MFENTIMESIFGMIEMMGWAITPYLPTLEAKFDLRRFLEDMLEVYKSLSQRRDELEEQVNGLTETLRLRDEEIYKLKWQTPHQPLPTGG